MESDVYASGWHALVDPQAKVAGVWTQVQEVYGNHGGVWSTTWKRNFVKNKTFSVDTLDYAGGITAEMLSDGWNGTDPVVLTITINSGIVLGSSSTGAALIIPALPGGSVVYMSNLGYILGRGGMSGGSGEPGSPGQPGGLAFTASNAITIDNTGGTIGGGGGGGGGGASFDFDNPGAPGGGGAGRSNGAAFSGGPNGDAENGTDTAGGSGGSGVAAGGNGGNGGNLGQAGSIGGGGTHAAGGAAGAAITGYGNITWAAGGTVLGAVS